MCMWRRLFRQWEKDEGRLIVGSIRRIEIVDDEGALGVVYFPMPAWVLGVWNSAHVEEAKKEIVMTVKRDNPEVAASMYLLLSCVTQLPTPSSSRHVSQLTPSPI